MTPWLYESLLLAVMGVSGVSLAGLFGFRSTLGLSAMAIPASVCVAIVVALLAWPLNASAWITPGFIASSVAIGAVGLWLKRVQWRAATGAIALVGVMSVVAVSSKYLWAIGEMEHTDSSQIVAYSLIGMQNPDFSAQQLGSLLGTKRGPAYPLLLSLGAPGSIFSSLTPLIFLATVLVLVWAALDLTPSHIPRWLPLAGLAIIFAFLLSVPMVRIALFYLNSHTLLGLALLLMVLGFVRTLPGDDIDALSLGLLVTGGVIVTTSRSEGIGLAIIVLAALAGRSIERAREARVKLAIALAGTLVPWSWWLITLQSPVADIVPGGALVVLIACVGAIVGLSTSLIDPLRPVLLPTLIGMLLVYLSYRVWSFPFPSEVLLQQWPNLVEGAGGWGNAWIVIASTIVILGWRRQPLMYHWLVVFLGSGFLMIFAAKTLDGGAFGREGFFDSLNRMYLHLLPLAVLALTLGLTQILARARRDSLTHGADARRVGSESRPGSP